MVQQRKRVLVLGASGMLGNAVLRTFASSDGYQVFGSVRSSAAQLLLPSGLQSQIESGVDVENWDSLVRLFSRVRPDVVINCIGIVKQLSDAEDVLTAIPINTLLPHRLARLCELTDARLVHMSTDCVFTGAKGMYTETDPADAQDVYGRSKHLGEVDYKNAITLRTSIIGHELQGARSLINWFLSQQGQVRGFNKAIFSGLPTNEMARVIRDVVIPNPSLRGLYHVSAAPINKLDLLTLVAQAYGKSIQIIPDDSLVIDRSLDSARFTQATGYTPAPWPELIDRMHTFFDLEKEHHVQ